jgi:16S rRNA (cytosine1402-N4)-methyltransferase
MENLIHNTVLLNETIDMLNIKPEGIYVDCTLGGGGHSEQICSRLTLEGTLIGIDQDEYAIGRAKERLKKFDCRKEYINDNFRNIRHILEDLDIEKIDGLIYDLGVSSFQFDDEKRGFSYHNDGPLDMRMDNKQYLSAYEIVNDYPQEMLAQVISEYGEERFAKRIAREIVKHREKKPVSTTLELVEIIKKAYPEKEKFKGKHPARKTFQAIRIEVNNEIKILEQGFVDAIEHLKSKGRICIITFHSMEDRIVKQLFKKLENPCTCPPDFPQCICGKEPSIKRVNRKPIIPDEKEIFLNRRSRSAKLRVAEKL